MVCGVRRGAGEGSIAPLTGGRLGEVDEQLVRSEAVVMMPYTKLSEGWLRFCRRELDFATKCHVLRWICYLRVNLGYTVPTGQNYLRGMGDFCEHLGAAGLKLDQVTLETADGYLQACYVERRLAAQTRVVRVAAIKSFFDWREKAGLGASPVRQLRGPKKVKNLPRKFTAKQLAALFAVCDRTTVKGRRDYAVLLFMYSTGARRMEVEALRMHDVEVRERSGRVRFHGKGAKQRMVSFEGPIIDALRAWLTDRDAMQRRGTLVDADAVFVSLGSHPGHRLSIQGLWNIIRDAVGRAKLRDTSGWMGLHRLRATFATDLYDQGYDVREIQGVLGHEEIKTTLGYIALSKRQAKVRLSAGRLYRLVGDKRNDEPLWFKRKKQQRGTAFGTDE